MKSRTNRKTDQLSIPEPKSVAGRVVPMDLDAEAAVLSAVLLERDALDRVVDLLKPEMFFSDANRRVFEAVRDLVADGSPVDIQTVASWLRSREWINQIGGPGYLVQIVDATPSVANVEAHAIIVADKWRLRQFIGGCQRTVAEAYGDIGGTVDEFIGQHEEMVRHLLGAAPGRKESERMGTIMKSVFANVEEACKRRASGLAPRELVETGFTQLDKRLAGEGLLRGNLYIIGGRPGQGKTAMALNMALQICEPPTDDIDPTYQMVEHLAFVWSGEMPREQLVLRLWCGESGVPFSRAAGGHLTPDEWQAFVEFGAILEKLPIIIEDVPCITVPELEARVRQARASWERKADPSRHQRERRISLVVVDYLTLMGDNGTERSREEAVSNNSKGLKTLAKRIDVPVLALVQLNRAVESRTVKDKRPQMADIRESGQIEQDADMIGFMYRPEYYHPNDESLRGIAELNIAKQRSDATNKTVFFNFIAERTKFCTPDATMMARIADIYSQGQP